MEDQFGRIGFAGCWSCPVTAGDCKNMLAIAALPLSPQQRGGAEQFETAAWTGDLERVRRGFSHSLLNF